MKADAISEARIRLRRAQSAITELQRLDFDFERQEDAWWSFLMAADQIYEKLKIGARGDPRAEPWFGSEEHRRRKDPLLRYIHQARNSDQHGLATATARTKPDLISVQGAEIIRDAGGNPIEVRTQVGVYMEVRMVPPAIKLVTVHDEKHHDSCDPPTEHRSKPLSDNSPAAVAALALEYLSGLIDRGAAYVR